MTIMYPGDSQPERVPAVFDDRVIFGYPDRAAPPPPPPRRGGGGMLAALIMFGVMLVPVAILSALVWNLNNKIEQGDQEDVQKFQADIDKLTLENGQLAAAVVDRDKTIKMQKDALIANERLMEAYNPTVRELIQERQTRVDGIGNLLSSGDDGVAQLPPELRNMPPWSTEAVSILTIHNDALKKYEDDLRKKLNQPPAQPIPRGVIGAGATDTP
ncbi:MAG: hypothetical protein RLO80_13165 [Hyphomonas sp.]